MTLCIVGKQTLDELEAAVISLQFGDIKDKKQERKVWNTHPYGAEQLGYRLEVRFRNDIYYYSVSLGCSRQRSSHLVDDISDSRSTIALSIATSTLYRYCICRFFELCPIFCTDHILGHEGPYSLTSELKRRGFVTWLCAGARYGAPGFGFIDIEVNLSEGSSFPIAFGCSV